MKKHSYTNPQITVIMLAPSRDMMESITLGTSDSISSPVSGRRGVVSFSPNN